MHYSFYIFLVFAVWFSAVNAVRGLKGHSVPPINFFLMACAIAGCVYSAIELS